MFFHVFVEQIPELANLMVIYEKPIRNQDPAPQTRVENQFKIATTPATSFSFMFVQILLRNSLYLPLQFRPQGLKTRSENPSGASKTLPKYQKPPKDAHCSQDGDSRLPGYRPIPPQRHFKSIFRSVFIWFQRILEECCDILHLCRHA